MSRDLPSCLIPHLISASASQLLSRGIDPVWCGVILASGFPTEKSLAKQHPEGQMPSALVWRRHYFCTVWVLDFLLTSQGHWIGSCSSALKSRQEKKLFWKRAVPNQLVYQFLTILAEWTVWILGSQLCSYPLEQDIKLWIPTGILIHNIYEIVWLTIASVSWQADKPKKR